MSFEEIGSTNEYVRRNLTLKEFEVVVAKKQTDDKLKKMNIWISDKGGAFFSFWIQDKCELQEKIEIFSCYIVYEIILKRVQKTILKMSLKILNLNGQMISIIKTKK